MEHNNPSIIENLFYLTRQNKIFCEKCKSTMYYYEYKQSLLVELNGNENNISIKDTLFQIKYKQAKCYKCNNNCKGEIKFEEFPQMLIVIIKRNNNENFTVKNNFKILGKSGILYSLNCFIEKNTNNVYFKSKKDSFWYKMDIDTNEKIESNNIIYDVEPAVLFFKGMFNEIKYQNYNQVNQFNNNMMINNSFNNMAPNNFIGNNNNNNFFNNNISLNNLNNKMNLNNMNGMNNNMNNSKINNNQIQMNNMNNQMNMNNSSNLQVNKNIITI